MSFPAPLIADYYTVGDTNPGADVWQTSVGAQVVVSDATFNTWLTGGAPKPLNIGAFAGTASNAGAIQITCDTTANLTTGLRCYFVGAQSGVAAVFPVHVDDATHFTLTGSTFTVNDTSAQIVGATFIDTMADLLTQIDNYNRALWTGGQLLGVNTTTLASTAVQPLPSTVVNVQIITVATTFAGVLRVSLPLMNVPGAPPKGAQILFVNQAISGGQSHLVNVLAQDGTTSIVGISPPTLAGSQVNNSVMLELTSNATQNGTFAVQLVTQVPLAAINGGLGLSSPTAHAVILGAANNPVTFAPVGVAGQILIDQGAGFDPVFEIMTGGATIDKTGKFNLILQGYLGGLGLANDAVSPNTVLDIASGVCMSDDATTMMALTTSYTKTTGAWVLGIGNGALDTGAVANTTWYHVFIIERTDTGGVDILFSASATSPTLPTHYNKQRRIGSFLTDGSAHIIAFVQDGDVFRWATPLADVNAVANPGTAAVTRTLTVPTGVQVFADITVGVNNTGGSINPITVYISDLALPDTAASSACANLFAFVLGLGAGPNWGLGAMMSIRTNTSAQVRSRLQGSDANTFLYITTLGWTDRRGAR